jgi:hypothetical protein
MPRLTQVLALMGLAELAAAEVVVVDLVATATQQTSPMIPKPSVLPRHRALGGRPPSLHIDHQLTVRLAKALRSRIHQ